jgi:hypothetical protein
MRLVMPHGLIPDSALLHPGLLIKTAASPLQEGSGLLQPRQFLASTSSPV